MRCRPSIRNCRTRSWICSSDRWNPKAGIPGFPMVAPPCLIRLCRYSSDRLSMMRLSARLPGRISRRVARQEP
ncbi:MAG: hypothetical protein A2X51_07370 [Candidatus Rokubacteria bacterium GWC2_70_24]|nr:MAG: hypothetical protein A2X51_07370 [Candidatus Rokubacteria bacterium GWC2_70_24]OGK94274.1 MAG: hypothetical protein A2X50_16070 [Candidatus Rokubacteria bacterium GWF2_70_14]